MDFIRNPSSQPGPLPHPIPLLSAYLSSLNAPTFPAIISALLVAIKHHAHVRKPNMIVMIIHSFVFSFRVLVLIERGHPLF